MALEPLTRNSAPTALASRASYSTAENPGKQIPRGLKPDRDDKIKRLIGTTEVVLFQTRFTRHPHHP
jgi:hypothetical protein